MIREVLTRTKAVLEERGWGRDWVENDYYRVHEPDAGCVCLATAVALACDYSGDVLYVQSFLEQRPLAKLALAALSLTIATPWSVPVIAVVRWNDAQGRTKEQVIELINRTIRKVGDDARVSDNDVR